MRAFLTAALLALVLPTLAADATNDVRCREIGFSLTAERRDIDAFRSFLDADARFATDGILRGIEEITAAWSVFFEEDGPSIKWRPQIIEVLEDGRLALSRGPYRVIVMNADGDPVERWGTFNSVWRLHDDGVWRVVFDAGSPAAEPPDEASRALLDAEINCP